MKNVLVHWRDLKRGDLIKWKWRTYSVIGFNVGARSVQDDLTHVIYCNRMLFGKWRMDKVKRILVNDFEKYWFEVIN